MQSDVVNVCHQGNEEGRVAAQFAVEALQKGGLSAIASSVPDDSPAGEFRYAPPRLPCNARY
eukprot:2223691-Rhodomonas_salina.2